MTNTERIADANKTMDAIAHNATMDKLYAEFIRDALEDGAKKKPDIDEPYTSIRPYCD